MGKQPAIVVDNVSVLFNMNKEKVDNIKEYFVQNPELAQEIEEKVFAKLAEENKKTVNRLAARKAVAAPAEAEEITALVLERTQAKKDKDFAKADQIRNDLQSRGVIIIDTPNGPIWKRN